MREAEKPGGQAHAPAGLSRCGGHRFPVHVSGQMVRAALPLRILRTASVLFLIDQLICGDPGHHGAQAFADFLNRMGIISAAANPAIVRSRIRSLSKFANAANMLNDKRPAGVVVSICAHVPVYTLRPTPCSDRSFTVVTR